MAIDELYASQVQSQTHKNANWLPNRPLEVAPTRPRSPTDRDRRLRVLSAQGRDAHVKVS
jgi:hypothetical protein